MRLDELDRRLIAALKEDGRMSFTALAGRMGVAEGTARNRLNRLIDSSTMRIAPILDQTKIGYRLNVWMGIRSRPGTFRDIADALSKLHAVRYVGACTGAYDVICELVFLSQREMVAFLEEEVPRIDGIVDTQTSLVLEITKLGYEWELREEDARPDQVNGEGEGNTQ
jgi:Lrp/AsnC family transcriptional regulator, regulator for asnA, asnC and gidA